MTLVYITIDTEYSYSLSSGADRIARKQNFARSIMCETPSGPVGIGYNMDIFDRYGLKAVFFVDPMPALVWGVEAIADIVRPIVARGHDVQLHCHTEWLALAGKNIGENNPLSPGRTGQNIKDFTEDEQYTLLKFARDTLVAAGAPAPVAFRAGNYGSNDDTLRALTRLGLRYETSHCPGIAAGESAISLTPENRLPVQHCGMIEVPVACIGDFGGGYRHAQITALSAREMLSAIAHARDNGIAAFTLVSHSFELMCRQRRRANFFIRRRFEKLCAGIAAMPGVETATYADNPPAVAPDKAGITAGITAGRQVLPLKPLRSGMRIAEQAIANAFYGR